MSHIKVFENSVELDMPYCYLRDLLKYSYLSLDSEFTNVSYITAMTKITKMIVLYCLQSCFGLSTNDNYYNRQWHVT